LLIIGVALIYAVQLPDMYESQTKILVKMGRETVEMIPTRDNSRMLVSNQTSIMETEIEILRSKVVYEDIINKIGMKRLLEFVSANSRDIIPSEVYTLNNKVMQLLGAGGKTDDTAAENKDATSKLRESFINYFQNNIHINVPRNSNVITISFTSRNPEFSFLVLSSLTEAFYKRHVELHFSDSTTNFFERQVKEASDQLRDKEQKITELKNRLNISSLETSLGAYDSRIREIQTEIDRAQIEKVSLQAQIGTLRQSVNENPSSGYNQGSATDAGKLAVLRELMARERDLLTKYSEENIQVKEVRRQIEEIRKDLNDNSPGTPVIISDSQAGRGDLLDAEMALLASEVRIEELKKQMARTSEEIRRLNDAQLELSMLERDREIQNTSFQKYSENLEEARIDGIVHKENMTNIEIMQKATLPLTPIPNMKMRIMIMALIFGFGASMALAFFLNHMDHSIKTAEDIEKKLNVHTLAVIPQITALGMQRTQ
jgi:uncharacterized protein involved in exopolysaccharide biosynthesis